MSVKFVVVNVIGNVLPAPSVMVAFGVGVVISIVALLAPDVPESAVLVPVVSLLLELLQPASTINEANNARFIMGVLLRKKPR
jgi:hypothetical protein